MTDETDTTGKITSGQQRGLHALGRGCDFPGCDKPHDARGWCQGHRLQVVSGRPLAPLRAHVVNPAEKRRWIEEVAQTSDLGCIRWPWSLVSGYGSLCVAGKTTQAGHLILAASGRPRPAPPANYMLHSCPTPNRACCNPHHLRWGTAAENMRDRSRQGRQPHTLTETQVREIRQRCVRGRGGNTTALAREYGVTITAINNIMTRLTWAHIEDGAVA